MTRCKAPIPSVLYWCCGLSRKHFAAPNPKTDLKYLKLKVDLELPSWRKMFLTTKSILTLWRAAAGGHYRSDYSGIKPITTKAQGEYLANYLPYWYSWRFSRWGEQCTDNKAVKKLASSGRCNNLKSWSSLGVPTLHFLFYGQAARDLQNCGKSCFNEEGHQ